MRRHADLLLHAVIKHVMESDEFGYRVKRADEDADPGMIGDRVVADILHSDLVLADLTDLNPNALYELGIRHATLKPTVHVAKAGTILPFDNISHRTIFVDLSDWHSIEAGRKRLSESVRAIREPEFQVSNPITQANASFKMRESADPLGQSILQLQERLVGIETRLTGSQEIGNKFVTTNRKHISEPDDDILFVDTIPIFGRNSDVFRLQYSRYNTFQDLLNVIYSRLNTIDNRIKERAYDKQWTLEGKGGKKYPKRTANSDDTARTLAEIGIFPGDTLQVKPLSRDWATM